MNESQLGAVGEQLVIAELLIRGFVVATPVVDVNGFDLLASPDSKHYHRVQVKTRRHLTYHFFSGGRGGSNAKSDFFILCCLFHKSFYVIPTREMPPGVKLSGDGSGKSAYEKNLSAFNLMSNNLSKKV